MDNFNMGPSYWEQQCYRRDKYFDAIHEIMYDPEDSYDEGVTNTELVYNERIRNKLSPITNLITLINAAIDRMDDNVDSTLNALDNIRKINLLDHCKKSVEELLDIPHT